MVLRRYHTLNNPINFIDPKGEFVFVPVLVALWGITEIGLSIYDGFVTAKTLLDPCASKVDKAVTAGLFVSGLLTVGGGYALAREKAIQYGDDIIKLGRREKQARLRELVNDSTVSSADRGWIKQEINSIQRGQRSNIRVPQGRNLSHRRGFEAKKGYGYEHSDLQDIDLHKLQHKYEGY